MRMRRLAVMAWVTGCLLGLGPTSPAPAPARAASKHPENGPDPKALAALARMGDFLRSQSSFKIIGETTTDDLAASGQKVEYNATFEMTVRRPDGLRADVNGDRKQEKLFFDGKTFAVYQPALGYYASFQAPPTLAQLIEVAQDRYGLDLPLADLFFWGTDKSPVSRVRSAFRVGASSVRGVPCDHYAFHQEDVDWELWIQSAGPPLPRQLVVTTLSAPSEPQHRVVLSWDLSPSFRDDIFKFTPPATAHRIDFETASPGMGTRQGRTAPRKGAKP